MLAVLVYLLKTKPNFKTIAVVNQDYAWGRESWEIFSTALKQMKPDVQVVAELFPKFGAPDYSTEVSRLMALRPDVVFTTSWGGDLDTLVRQAGQRGLLQQSTFVLAIGKSSIQRLGKDLPEGLIIGARGDHWFLHPEKKDDAEFKAFNEAFKAKTGRWPIYPVYHMEQAFAALQGAYDKAIKANGGKWPTREQVVDAAASLEFVGFGRPVTLAPEDNQGLEAQLVGVSKKADGFDHMVLDNMMIFDAAKITTPAGKKSVEWLKTLKPDFAQDGRAGVPARQVMTPDAMCGGRYGHRAVPRPHRSNSVSHDEFDALRSGQPRRPGLCGACLPGLRRAQPDLWRAAHRQCRAWQPLCVRRLPRGDAEPAGDADLAVADLSGAAGRVRW